GPGWDRRRARRGRDEPLPPRAGRRADAADAGRGDAQQRIEVRRAPRPDEAAMRASDRHDEKRRGDRRGVAMVTVLVALVALIAAAALAIDVGLVMVARTQLQNATDAAALAGGANLIDVSGPTVTASAARTAAQGEAGLNKSIAEPVPDGISVNSGEIVLGHWDLATRTFNSSVDTTDPNQVNAIDVTTHQDGVANSPVPAI